MESCGSRGTKRLAGACLPVQAPHRNSVCFELPPYQFAGTTAGESLGWASGATLVRRCQFDQRSVAGSSVRCHILGIMLPVTARWMRSCAGSRPTPGAASVLPLQDAHGLQEDGSAAVGVEDHHRSLPARPFTKSQILPPQTIGDGPAFVVPVGIMNHWVHVPAVFKDPVIDSVGVGICLEVVEAAVERDKSGTPERV